MMENKDAIGTELRKEAQSFAEVSLPDPAGVCKTPCNN
jgi:hypothetical protein